MAKNIKGITIEIGGNATGLENALKDVNKIVYSTNSELKNLNQALKLDPKNTELLAQKQDVLRKNIAATTERLETLKEAQRQMGDYNSLTEEQKEQYRALSVEIAKSENALEGMNKELRATSGIDMEKVKGALKKVGEVAVDVAKKMAAVTAAMGGALAGMVTAGVKSYAELEQNLGGVETLFGKSADKVVKNAQNAYKTAGVSANEYMAGVTSFSASLLQSLGGDTEKAADVADMAFRDMSDNANKFGSDMGSIQNAYQGFAKQNYTMLDNLKLGYGGTKTEMERLLSDAEKLSGKKYDIKNLNDVYEAIHVVQEELGVTGTTADEAEKTISGSIASTKAAFDNFLNGSGSPKALAESLTNVFTNISGAVMKLAPDILNGVVQLIQTLIPQIGQLLLQAIPQLLDAIKNLIIQLNAMLVGNTEPIAKAISTIITQIVKFIADSLPVIIQAGIWILIALIEGLTDTIPKIIPVILEAIKTICNVLIENLPMLIEAAIELILALIEGFTEAMPQLAEYIPEIITTIVSTIIENLPMLLKAALQLIIALGKGLITYEGTLLSYVVKIPIAIVKGIIEGVPKMIDAAWKLIKGLIQGMKDKVSDVKEQANKIIEKIKEVFTKMPEKAKKWGKDMIDGLKQGIKDKIASVGDAVSGVADKIRSLLHFSRPDEGPLREYEKWMPDFMKGLAKGIDKYSYLVVDATDSLAEDIQKSFGIGALVGKVGNAMTGLNAGIQSSINPTINPSVSYEENYAMMGEAMKEALDGMDIVLDDGKVGKFVIKTVTDEIYT